MEIRRKRLPVFCTALARYSFAFEPEVGSGDQWQRRVRVHLYDRWHSGAGDGHHQLRESCYSTLFGEGERSRDTESSWVAAPTTGQSIHVGVAGVVCNCYRNCIDHYRDLSAFAEHYTPKTFETRVFFESLGHSFAGSHGYSCWVAIGNLPGNDGVVFQTDNSVT